ncbi:hypothetical protein [Streptomyces albireticuli]|uniref:hypothetical protein n=1 Tax=Streptomyces albireticuli TaxID=1940 RepID=UPI0014754FB8|nr:hypothetical protein [Streptomyces albireticuli]MCD9141080.1 hypothetical protein [Streptomyces albireticuli]MCD9160959.1 hypothetical protein [Streptomyces albireticuli]MCD9190984.1 hypothetical protein [Streptomyces albireticuli]
MKRTARQTTTLTDLTQALDRRHPVTITYAKTMDRQSLGSRILAEAIGVKNAG